MVEYVVYHVSMILRKKTFVSVADYIIGVYDNIIEAETIISDLVKNRKYMSHELIITARYKI